MEHRPVELRLFEVTLRTELPLDQLLGVVELQLHLDVGVLLDLVDFLNDEAFLGFVSVL